MAVGNGRPGNHGELDLDDLSAAVDGSLEEGGDGTVPATVSDAVIDEHEKVVAVFAGPTVEVSDQGKLTELQEAARIASKVLGWDSVAILSASSHSPKPTTITKPEAVEAGAPRLIDLVLEAEEGEAGDILFRDFERRLFGDNPEAEDESVPTMQEIENAFRSLLGELGIDSYRIEELVEDLFLQEEPEEGEEAVDAALALGNVHTALEEIAYELGEDFVD